MSLRKTQVCKQTISIISCRNGRQIVPIFIIFPIQMRQWQRLWLLLLLLLWLHLGFSAENIIKTYIKNMQHLQQEATPTSARVKLVAHPDFYLADATAFPIAIWMRPFWPFFACQHAALQESNKN